MSYFSNILDFANDSLIAWLAILVESKTLTTYYDEEME
jgi:hypothetical protein